MTISRTQLNHTATYYLNKGDMDAYLFLKRVELSKYISPADFKLSAKLIEEMVEDILKETAVVTSDKKNFTLKGLKDAWKIINGQ